MQHYLQIGKLGKIFGLEGYLRVWIHDGMDEVWEQHIANNQAIFIGIDAFKIPFFIANYLAEKGLVQFKKIASHEQLEEMASGNLYIVSHEDNSELKINSNKLEDFVIVDSNTNHAVGRIDRIEEFPAHAMAIVKYDKGEWHIPLVEEWVTELDMEGNKLYLDLPEGLLDI